MSPPGVFDDASDLDGRAVPLRPLLAAFGPATGEWRAITPVPGGRSDHFRVESDAGLLWLRRAHRHKALLALLAQFQLQAELRWRGFPAPTVVPTTTGSDVVEADGRLWSATWDIPGSGYDAARSTQLEAAARALADYHGIAAEECVVALFAGTPEGCEVIATLRLAIEAAQRDNALAQRSGEVLQQLEQLSPQLPRLVVHGGCRRASMRYRGDELVGVLDFNSARPDVRVLDLAVALHDFGKVAGPPGSPDTGVALDLGRVAAFMAAYRSDVELSDSEQSALPLLLVAKRLLRGLGRLRPIDGLAPTSADDVEKLSEEAARVAWLDAHDGELREALRP